MVDRKDYGSFWKAMNLVGRITTTPLEVKYGNQRVLYEVPKSVTLSLQFFRSAKCRMCGKCCSGFSTNKYNLVFFEKPYQLEGNPNLVEEEFYMNNKKYPVWIYRNKNQVCDFARNVDGKIVCAIHTFKPLHCLFPPVFIDQRKQHTVILKRPFSRNWQFGCPVEFKPFDYREYIAWDVYIFERLGQVMSLINQDILTHSFFKEIFDVLNDIRFTGVIPNTPVRWALEYNINGG